MSDTPDWLKKTETDETAAPAFSLAAPAEALAANPEELRPPPIATNNPLEASAIADMLIKFKRFWQTNPGTSTEIDFAIECAELIIEITNDADKS